MSSHVRCASREAAYKIAMSAGWDAGDRQCKANGRKTWDEADWSEAARVQRDVMGFLGFPLPEETPCPA